MASYEGISNILSFAVSLRPDAAFPLDARSMFGSYAAAEAAAASAVAPGSSDGIYYIGQTLTVYENGVVADYKIQENKTLKAIGASVIGDDKTVVVKDEKLSLKYFGEKYYAYVKADTIVTGEFTYPDAMPADAAVGSYVQIGEVWYVKGEEAWSEASAAPNKTASYKLTEGWMSGLEPKVIQAAEGYELAWYEPSSTTVEGLNSIVSTVQTDVTNLPQTVTNNYNTLDTAIKAEETRATKAESDLSARITANKNSIDVLNGGTDVEGSVKKIVADSIALVLENPSEGMDSVMELVTWVNDHGTDAAALTQTVEGHTTAINALQELLGTQLPEGAVATNVIDYIVEAVAAEKARAEAAEKGLSDRLDTIEQNNQNLGSAAYENADAFATAAQGAKADTAVQSVVASATNGNVVVDGTEVKVYEAPLATAGAAGVVRPDATSIVADENGIIGVAPSYRSAIVTEAVSTAGTNAENYVNQNAVLVEHIAGSADIAASSEAASDTKVVSEKAMLAAMEWKTTM